MTFPDPLPHGTIQELYPEVYLVRGTFRVAPLCWIPRNMIVLREGGALALLNSVRLSPEGEKELLKLGEIKHLVKLGFFHSYDDPYYRDRFAATFWAPRPKDPTCEKLVEGSAGPCAKAEVFCFETTSEGEAAFVLRQPQGNLLITCDSVQNWVDTQGCSFLGAIACRLMGFLQPAKIGPMWAKKLTNDRPSLLRPDFERLLTRDFRHLIAGHGVLLRDKAKEALRRSCEKELGMQATQETASSGRSGSV